MNVQASMGMSSALRDFHNGNDVVSVRARRTVRTNLESLVGNLAGHQLDTRCMCATRARQTDVGRVDSQRVHQMQQLDLFLNGWFADRGRLQTVAQRLVVKPDVAIGFVQLRINLVPVID